MNNIIELIIDGVFLGVFCFWFFYGIYFFIILPQKRKRYSIDYNEEKFIYYYSKKCKTRSEILRKIYIKKLEKLKARITKLKEFQEEWFKNIFIAINEEYSNKPAKTCTVVNMGLLNELKKEGKENGKRENRKD